MKTQRSCHSMQQLLQNITIISKYARQYTACSSQRRCCLCLINCFFLSVFFFSSSLNDSSENELESLRDALLKTRLDTTPPKTKPKSPGMNLSYSFHMKTIKDTMFLNFNIPTVCKCLFSSQDFASETVPAAQLPLKGTDASCPLDCTRYKYPA